MADLALALAFLVGSGIALLVAIRLENALVSPPKVAPEPPEERGVFELIDDLERVVLQAQDDHILQIHSDLAHLEKQVLLEQQRDAEHTREALVRRLETRIQQDVEERGIFRRIGFDVDRYVRDTLTSIIVVEYRTYIERSVTSAQDQRKALLEVVATDISDEDNDEATQGAAGGQVVGTVVKTVGFVAAARLVGVVTGPVLGVALVSAVPVLRALLSRPQKMAIKARGQVRDMVDGLFLTEGYHPPGTPKALPGAPIEAARYTREDIVRAERALASSAENFRKRAKEYCDQLRLEAARQPPGERALPSAEDVVQKLLSDG